MSIRIGLIGLAVAMFAAAAPAAASPSDPFFIPNTGHDQDAQQRRAGGHYSIVVANLTRRCTDLSSQFNQALAHTADSAVTRGAMPDYRQGVALCDQGQRMQGVDTLEAALKEIGAIPRITY